MLIGSLIGLRLAKKVEMTEMPELIAVLHSFVGLAAVLVGYNSFLNLYLGTHTPETDVLLNIELIEIFLGIFIGAITFTGSIVAYGKLHGLISSKALSIPGKHKLNLLAHYCYCCSYGFICYGRWTRTFTILPNCHDSHCFSFWMAFSSLYWWG